MDTPPSAWSQFSNQLSWRARVPARRTPDIDAPVMLSEPTHLSLRLLSVYSSPMPPATIHSTAHISVDAQIGDGTRIWHEAQVREGAHIGRECVLGKGVYVDVDVVIGDRCKIENRASLFRGVTLEEGVFVGPHAVFANDRFPRAVTPDGALKTDAD